MALAKPLAVSSRMPAQPFTRSWQP